MAAVLRADAGERDLAVPAAAHEEPRAVGADGLHAGHRGQALDQRAEDLALARLVVHDRGPDAHDDDVLGPQPEVHRAQLLQRADEEAGPDQEDGGEPDLHADEGLAQPDVPMAAGDGSRLGLQGGAGRHPRGLQRGHEAEEERGREGERGGEEEDPQVGRRREREVRGVEGQEAQERPRQRQAEDEPGDAAGDGQDQALHQELAHDLAAPRAERGPDRDLLLSRRGAREQQVRDVGAGDEEHQADQALQDDERLLEPLPQVRVSARRGHDQEGLLEEPLLGVGELGEELALQLFLLALGVEGAQRGLGLLPRDPRLEPAEQVEPGGALVLEVVVGRVERRLHRHGDPEPRQHGGVRPDEARGGDADHGERRPVEPDGRADDLGVSAEPLLPEVVLQDGDGRRRS